MLTGRVKTENLVHLFKYILVQKVFFLLNKKINWEFYYYHCYIIIIVVIIISTVSYTHLDVYKRQLRSLDDATKIDAKIQILSLLKSLKFGVNNQLPHFPPFNMNQSYDINGQPQMYSPYQAGMSGYNTGLQNFQNTTTLLSLIHI